MTAPSRRTFTNAAVLLGVGLFALGGASLIPPMRTLERWIVKRVAVMIDPVDTIIDGKGSQNDPWTRRKATPPVVPAPPRFLVIDDTPAGWFSAAPPAPVDQALIFARLQEAGHKVLGVGYLMAWEEPEPLAMGALRKQLDKFDAAVLALPLARGAGGEPVPAPFLRMSLAASEVKGDASSFPLVNRLAVPEAELGGERGLAGFSLLENEADPGDGRQPLLARWNDRILFAFPLAAEIAARGLEPGEVMIHAGKDIRLGSDGPVLAIDEFGRTPVRANALAMDIPAMRLVSEDNPVPPMSDVLLSRDVRAVLPPAERAWSDRLAGMVQALRAAPRFEPAVTLPRPDAMFELALISMLTLFGTWATRLRSLGWRIIAALLIAGLSVELLYLLASRQNAWLPPLALLCPGVAALGLSFLREEKPAPEPTFDAPMKAESLEPAPDAEEPEAAAVEIPRPPAVLDPYEWPEREAPAIEIKAPSPVDDIPRDAPAEEVTPPTRKTGRKTTAKKAVTKTAARKTAKKAPAVEAPPPAEKEAPKVPAKKAVKRTSRKAKPESGET